jgi:DNA-binding protein HU-beta
MTKPELVAEVAKQVGITKADAGRAVDAFVNLIAGELEDNGRMEITGLGVFKVFTQAACSRPSIQDRTKTIHTPERNTVKFRPSPALKAVVNS